MSTNYYQFIPYDTDIMWSADLEARKKNQAKSIAKDIFFGRDICMVFPNQKEEDLNAYVVYDQVQGYKIGWWRKSFKQTVTIPFKPSAADILRIFQKTVEALWILYGNPLAYEENESDKFAKENTEKNIEE